MAQPPIDKIRMGNLSAAIWQNLDAQEQPFFTCTFSRSYTDAEGTWHDSPTFGRGDLLRLSKLADQAHSRIEELIKQEREAVRSTSETTAEESPNASAATVQRNRAAQR